MKVKYLFAFILLLFIGCESEIKLNVLFVNKDSEFTITDLYVKMQRNLVHHLYQKERIVKIIF